MLRGLQGAIARQCALCEHPQSKHHGQGACKVPYCGCDCFAAPSAEEEAVLEMQRRQSSGLLKKKKGKGEAAAPAGASGTATPATPESATPLSSSPTLTPAESPAPPTEEAPEAAGAKGVVLGVEMPMCVNCENRYDPEKDGGKTACQYHPGNFGRGGVICRGNGWTCCGAGYLAKGCRRGRHTSTLEEEEGKESILEEMDRILRDFSGPVPAPRTGYSSPPRGRGR
eukprot:Hpha_TRINITY_DN34061_c0_g1::TRINITY_DN34061_c0_g1_i1::g.30521::m.30521